MVTVNGTMTAAFALEAGGKPGTAVILPFEETAVTSLTVDFEGEARVGEMLLIGEDK